MRGTRQSARGQHRVPAHFSKRTATGRRNLTAYHEAAHAVVFDLLGYRVLSIDVQRRGPSKARTTVPSALGDDAGFDEAVRRAGVDAAITDAQLSVHGLLAGRVAEHVCRRERFDPMRFRRDTRWDSDGPDAQPFPLERLPPGDVQNSDRDKAHLLTACILRARPAIAWNVDEHLARSWHLTERMVREVWKPIDHVARALLRSDGGLYEDDIADIIDSAEGQDDQRVQTVTWRAEVERLLGG